MASVSSTITRGITKHFRQLEAAQDRATVQALNRAGRSAFGAVIKFLAGNYNISQKNLKKYFSFVKASRNKQVFTIRAQRKSLSFYLGSGSTRLFNVRQTKKGLKFTVRKGKPQIISSGFIAQMPSGHKGGWVRISSKQMPSRPGPLNKHTQQIKEIYALNVGNVFSGKLTQNELEDKFFERFIKEFNQALQYQMSKIK